MALWQPIVLHPEPLRSDDFEETPVESFQGAVRKEFIITGNHTIKGFSHARKPDTGLIIEGDFGANVLEDLFGKAKRLAAKHDVDFFGLRATRTGKLYPDSSILDEALDTLAL